ncbi:hypothetical protein E4N62_45510, partial [Streptomyces sp. MNU76]|uniref:hypothetical protein n=1 Tax=Streptomyces sp. MNU76 TaxID=2560026 RepID=UPI001E2B5B4B
YAGSWRGPWFVVNFPGGKFWVVSGFCFCFAWRQNFVLFCLRLARLFLGFWLVFAGALFRLLTDCWWSVVSCRVA